MIANVQSDDPLAFPHAHRGILVSGFVDDALLDARPCVKLLVSRTYVLYTRSRIQPQIR